MVSGLSETQRQILTIAAQRKGGLVLPVTSKLEGGACTPSGLVRQIGAIQEGRISGSS
jgi:hypothetical protein